MELDSIRKFLHDHPNGMTIHMVDGERFDIPHRDWISFGPPQKSITGKETIRGTSFLIFDEAGVGMTSMKLINALLVTKLTPYHANGTGAGSKRLPRKPR